MNNSDGVLLMAKSYLIIDQPLAALEIYKKGLRKFPKDTVILSGIARCSNTQIYKSITLLKKQNLMRDAFELLESTKSLDNQKIPFQLIRKS
jgi:hypothetical protein